MPATRSFIHGNLTDKAWSNRRDGYQTVRGLDPSSSTVDLTSPDRDDAMDLRFAGV